jgi:putative transposase
MQLAERHIIKSTEHRFASIDRLAFQSKNLYNAANYVIRQNFVYGWGYLNYNKMAQLLINGRPLKSINQFYNKRKAHLQSQLKGLRKTSCRIQRLTRCRNQKIDNYLHHASRDIINLLRSRKIGTLVIGKNVQWKNKINLGKPTNQNFVTVPHARFIEMLEYKAALVGIRVMVQEESYTSQSSFLNLDPIPVYGKNGADRVLFSGKRIKRGLYKTSSGRLINADVNGSYNILRKAIPNALCDGIESCVLGPRRVNPLEVKKKGEGLNASHVTHK